MAFYYVMSDGVNDGTATLDAGRYASKQVGAMSALGVSSYYASISAAQSATTPPALGDTVYIADTSVVINTATLNLISGVCYICVSALNIDQSRRSGNRASEGGISASIDINTNDSYVSGLNINPNDDINVGANSQVGVLDDCIISVGTSDIIASLGSGSGMALNNVEMSADNSSARFQIANARTMDINKLTISSPITEMFNGFFNNGGGTVRCRNSNLTNVTNTLIANVGSNPSVDGVIDVTYYKCKLAVGVALTNEAFESANQRVTAIGCADNDVEMEYAYNIRGFRGDLDHDTSVYRNEDEAYPLSGQKISLEVVTTADCSESQPFWFDLTTEGIELSDGAKQELTVSLTSDTLLDNKQVYVQLLLADGTNYGDTNSFITCPATVGGTFDFLATATTLTTDVTSTWTGGLTNNYEISIDTSSLPCADQAVTVRVFVTEPSVTINFSEQLRVS